MIKILKATSKNAKLLSQISVESFLPAHGHSAPKDDINKYISKHFTEKIFEKELENPVNAYYLIYYKNKIAGYSKIVFNSPNNHIKAQNITKMERLYLLKEFYGLNLGSALFHFTMDVSKQHRQEGIWLAVWTENERAIGFYKKMAFQIVGSYNFKISETHYNPNHILYLKY